MAVQLKIFNLNCWGIRVPVFASKDVTVRMEAISNKICAGYYDLVVLEEVWSAKDYVALSCKILDKLPHTHYFHSGYLSGGVCIFSRYPIMETVYSPFPLNGHAHKMFHGDWYGSKGCGLTILKVQDFIVNLYTTHMHARYNLADQYDEYATHRAAQAFSMAQFVRNTSHNAHAVILAGDFNTTPNELAYRVIRTDATVGDAWLEKHGDGSHDQGATSDTPENCYTDTSVNKYIPNGQRIDYIFYRANHMTDVTLEDCEVVKDKVPGTNLDLSDHYGLTAKFMIKKNITAQESPAMDHDVRISVLRDMADVMDRGISKARYTRYFYFVTMLLALMMLLLTRERFVGEIGNLHAVLEVIQAIMAVLAGLSFWIFAVLSWVEQTAHLSVKMDAQNIIKSYSHSKAH